MSVTQAQRVNYEENGTTAQKETVVSSGRSGKAAGAFRTISEVAEELGVQQHVLRFWETKFSHVKPLKRGGGRRYYRPEDVALLKRIHELLYTEGYTIKGVQKLLKEQGKSQILDGAKKPMAAANETFAATQQAPVQAQQSGLTPRQRQLLQGLLGDLKEIRSVLAGE